MRRFISGQTTVLCARMLCNELKKQPQKSSRTPRGSPRTASHFHSICASGRDSAQPAMFVSPTVLGLERVNQYTGNKGRISNSVSSMDKMTLPDLMRFARKGADVIKIVTPLGQLQIYGNADWALAERQGSCWRTAQLTDEAYGAGSSRRHWASRPQRRRMLSASSKKKPTFSCPHQARLLQRCRHLESDARNKGQCRRREHVQAMKVPQSNAQRRNSYRR